MDWLNYHHLRYFWTVARAGSLARAAQQLHVSPPSISSQLRELEESLGQPLFRRAGRGLALTEAGQVALGYAEEIFTLGGELLTALKQRGAARVLRFHVGVADAVPKLVTNEILKPAFSLDPEIHVICREGKLEDLLAQLAAHRLDLVLADEPASTSANFRTFDHPLMNSGTTFCAAPPLARRLRPGFPRSLHGAIALLPGENTTLRRAVDAWFRTHRLRPRVAAEFEDLALMKVMAAEGRGFIAIPTITAEEALRRYGFERIGEAPRCQVRYHAITAERRVHHPATLEITRAAGRRKAGAT